MNERCTAPELGTLLHAYELGILEETENNQFEQHLLVCKYCHDRIEEFDSAAEILRSDKSLLSSVNEPRQYPVSPAAVSFFARPVVAYAIAALLAFMLIGSWISAPSEIKSITSVVLTPVRSAQAAEVSLEDDKDLLITFLYRGARSDEDYSVQLIGEDEKIVFVTDKFADFDQHETGRLVVPRKLLEEGTYRLIIERVGDSSHETAQEYRLLIR